MASIKIIASDPSTGNLTLSDHGHTKAPRGEHITWNLVAGCGVSSIEAISMKPSPPSTNIFSTLPGRAGNSTNWNATVSRNAAPRAEYNYYIDWKPTGSEEIKTFDPKITVKPPVISFSFKKKHIIFLLAFFGLLSLLFLR